MRGTIGTSNQPTKKLPLNAQDYTDFSNAIPSAKESTYQWFRQMLPRGGFEFDPTLWKWTTTGDAYSLNLWVEITWIDDGNIGKEAFLSYIKKTRVFDYNCIVVKPYS